MNKKMQCLLDMDGVLVGFTEAVEKRFGITVETWDFDRNLPVSPAEFWDECDEEFWAGLD